MNILLVQMFTHALTWKIRNYKKATPVRNNTERYRDQTIHKHCVIGHGSIAWGTESNESWMNRENNNQTEKNKTMVFILLGAV